MKYLREVVNEPEFFVKRHLSSFSVERQTFASAKIKQGGYGILDNTFWVERIADRGFHVFVLTLSGKGKFTFEDGTSLIVDKNQAFISASNGQGHKEETIGEEPWEMIWFTIEEESSRFKLSFNDYQIIDFTQENELKEYFLSIFKEESYDDAKSIEAIELYEQLFFITLERALNWVEDFETKGKRQKLSILWDTVAKNIEKPWTVFDLCNEINLSRAHLSRLSQEIYNCGPGEKVKSIKMNHAKFLLKNSYLTVFEIALSIGYDNPSTFSAAFSNYFKISPRNYRESSINK